MFFAGSYMACEKCGKQTPRRGSRQKFCPECAKAESIKNVSEKQKQLFDEGGRRRPRPIAPRTEPKTLSEVAKEARSLGLTYGRYMALIQSGGLEGYIREKERGR